MNSNYFPELALVAVKPVVKIKYAPQLEVIAVEPLHVTSPKIDAAPPFDWTPLLLFIVLVGASIVCGKILRHDAARRKFGVEATTHSA